MRIAHCACIAALLVTHFERASEPKSHLMITKVENPEVLKPLSTWIGRI